MIQIKTKYDSKARREHFAYRWRLGGALMDQIPASARIMAVPYPPRTVSHSWTSRGRRDLRPRGMAAGQTAVKIVREI